MSMNSLNELYNILSKDIASEKFTKREYIIYAIIAPLALVAACVLAEWLNTL